MERVIEAKLGLLRLRQADRAGDQPRVGVGRIAVGRWLQRLTVLTAANRPRALIQMATGTGRTLLAVTEIYRLIKFGGVRWVLFLVDRANLGEQAEKEFQGFRTPDDNRKFTELERRAEARR